MAGTIERNSSNLHDAETGVMTGYKNPITGKEVAVDSAALQSLVSRDWIPGGYPTHVLHSACEQTYAVDGVSGTTFHYVGTAAAAPHRIRPIFANGNTSTTYTIAGWSACPLIDPVNDQNNSGGTPAWTTGGLTVTGVVPVSPGTRRRGLLFGDWADIRNDTGSKTIAIRAFVAAGAGSITAAGISGVDLTNWATRSDMHLYRAQTGDRTVSIGGFTSTTNISQCPIIGFQYMAAGKVTTVMRGGDSIAFGTGATYKGEDSVIRAVLARNGSNKIDYCNLGWPSSDYAAYYDAISEAVNFGIVPNFCIFPCGTPNGVSTSIGAGDIRAMRYKVMLVLQKLQEKGSTPWLVTWLPSNSNLVSPNTASENYGATDSFRRDWNSEVLSWKASGMLVSDIAAPMVGGLDANGQQFITAGLTGDGIHPSDAGYEAGKTVILADMPF